MLDQGCFEWARTFTIVSDCTTTVNNYIDYDVLFNKKKIILKEIKSKNKL